MEHLHIEKLFGLTSLSLEVDKATCVVKDGVLWIEVTFSKVSPATAASVIASSGLPQDWWFKDSDGTLELELPIPKGINDILGNEFFIDSQDEDNENLTNFYIANTHYPTFDDRVLITKTDTNEYLLQWHGLMPDIKSSQYEMYMQIRYEFRLETPVIFQA